MSDFAVMGAIRSYLASHLGEEKIIFGKPEKQVDDLCCYLELEEMWRHMKIGTTSRQSLIKFKTTCIHPGPGLRSGLEFNEKVNDLLNGYQFTLNDGRSVVVRSLINIEKEQEGPNYHVISQIYESLIRG
jgi:hypothetical protein